MHLPTPARLVGRKPGLRRNPGPEGRCAKTPSMQAHPYFGKVATRALFAQYEYELSPLASTALPESVRESVAVQIGGLRAL